MSTEKLLSAPPQVTMALESLDGLEKIIVKQKVSKIEAITAMMGSEWERPNKYKIVDDGGQELFFAQETTGCCRRQLMACGLGQCMSWEVKFFKSTSGWTGYSREEIFDLSKPWQLSCCCINLPKAYLNATEDGTSFGYLQEPCCSLCPSFSAHAPNGDTLVTASSSCCQLGILFPCPCGPCSRVTWDLVDADGNDLGAIVKTIPLKWCKGCCPGQDIDYYHVDLAKLPNSTMKALVMAMTVFIDFRLMAKEDDEDAAAEGEVAAAEAPTDGS